jgi:hypothetical protein
MTSAGHKGEIVANTSTWASVTNPNGAQAARALAYINGSYKMSRCEVQTKEFAQEAYKVVGSRENFS